MISETTLDSDLPPKLTQYLCKECGGIHTDQARRLRELEKENARLKKLVEELSLDNTILLETVWGN